MLKSKKAGCTTYADVNSEYMLFPSATTQTPKTGGRKGGNSFANDLMSLTDMLKQSKGGNKKGGSFANDAVSFLKNMSSTASTMASTQQSVTPSVPVATTKAGCGSCAKKGGAIELAPFAAALAFLATRFATDKNFDMKKIMKSADKSMKSSMKSSSKSMKSSSMRSASKKSLSF
jgi:hypothetical protein